jgi:hypothetical protein
MSWLDKYEEGGYLGTTNKGFDYNGAWNGQFQSGGKVKKPIIVESKNDPRYRAYQDSLILSTRGDEWFNNKFRKREGNPLLPQERIDNALKNKPIGKKKMIDYTGGVEKHEVYTINGKKVSDKIVDTKKNKSFHYKNIYAAPQQPVIVKSNNVGESLKFDPIKNEYYAEGTILQNRKPIQAIQNNLQPEGLVHGNMELNADMSGLKPQARIPKYYDVEDIVNNGRSQTNYQWYPGNGEALRELSEESGDRRTMVPRYQTGGSLPGSVGFTYARTKGIPSEGPYAKKTMPSAQNGQEMRYFQEGLDWRPKTISRNGGWLDGYEKAQTGYTIGDKVTYGTPEYREAYNKGEVVTDEGVRSPIALDEVVIQNNYRRPRGFWEQYRDKIVDENKDAGPLGAIVGTPISAITSLPQLAATKLFSGNWNNEYYNMQRPSEAMDVENPYAAFAIDAVADPANLIGAGVLTKENALAKLSNLRNINAEGKIFTGLNNELNNLAIQNTERYMAKRAASNAPLSKELEPYISRIGEPSISREEEIFRNSMGPEYRAAKELENTKFLDPDGNIINSDIKQNNFGSIYTLNPLTLFGDDFNKPFLRKIGNSKGIKSLIENKAITSPGYSAPYFSPKTTWEGYNGTFAVGVDPEKVSPRFNKNVKSFDKFGNKTKGGLESLSMYNKSTGNLQRGYQSSWKEIPLEEGATSVFRRLPFTGAYKEIPLNAVLNPTERTFAQKIALNPHLADAQNIAEQALRYGIKLSVAQEIANSIFETTNNSTPFGNPIIPIKPVINKISNDKKKQGGIIKDEMGQWAHPGEITQIDSPYITMKGVPYPVLGVSNTGDVQMMYPEQEYEFDGDSVIEYPMARNGINNLDARPLVKLDQLTNFTNYNKPQPGSRWLSKYE